MAEGRNVYTPLTEKEVEQLRLPAVPVGCHYSRDNRSEYKGRILVMRQGRRVGQAIETGDLAATTSNPNAKAHHKKPPKEAMQSALAHLASGDTEGAIEALKQGLESA